MISHNMSGGGHSDLFGKSIPEIFFGRFAVPVRLVGLMAFKGHLQAPVRPVIRLVPKSSYLNCQIEAKNHTTITRP